MCKFISSPSSLLTCLPSPPSNQAEWVVVAAAAPATLMFEEGCYIYGGEMQRRRWLPRQRRGCGDRWLCAQAPVACVGNSMWEVAQLRAAPSRQSRLDYPCGALSYNHHLHPCKIMPAWGGHTNTDLLMCCICSFYPLVSIWDFFLDAALFSDYSGSAWGICNSNNVCRFGWENSV